MEAESKKAPDFAEAAEALGIRTVDVLAELPGRVVIFTMETDTEDDPPIWSATLDRDADGILIASPQKYVCLTSHLKEELEKLVATQTKLLGS
jgi:hypothetical protein